MKVVDLSSVPACLPVVAEWIYDVFWQDSGQSPKYIYGLLEEHLLGKPIPLTLVAMEAGRPIGSVCLIESDMVERLKLTPWLAALYVLPAHRKHGIGSQLVNHLLESALHAGFTSVYLSADEQVGLYARLEFAIFETKVGPKKLTIMRRYLG